MTSTIPFNPSVFTAASGAHTEALTIPAAPADFSIGDSGMALSPDSLLAYCQSRLDSIRDQVSTSFKKQSRNAAEISQMNQVEAMLGSFGAGDEKDVTKISDMETKLGNLIHQLKEADPGCAALPTLTQTYNNLVYSGTGGWTAADVGMHPGVMAADPNQFIDADKFPAEGTATRGDRTIGVPEMQGYAQNIKDAVGSMNSNSELQMIELQSLMAQRQTAISLTTNLVQSLGDQANKIAENIGH